MKLDRELVEAVDNAYKFGDVGRDPDPERVRKLLNEKGAQPDFVMPWLPDNKRRRLDVLMNSILDKEKLPEESDQKKKKLEVIKILGEFLRKPNSETKLTVPTWDREIDDNGFSWLGWTVVNGSADDVAALISSKQPYDPLLAILRWRDEKKWKNASSGEIDKEKMD